ncbi:MAG: hypothetical protein U0K86_00560 [Agathobacter sp.]|nr:hypothetical protein [Agathobacter sp.]
MKKNNSTTILPIIVGMISIVWIICILLLANIDGIEFFLWSGFSFAVTGFVLTFLGMKYFASRINDIGVEISIAPCWILSIFFLVTTNVNTIFVIKYDGEINVFVIIVNLILYVIYASILLYANSYVNHMIEIDAKIAEKTSSNDDYRMKVSMLMGMAKTPAVKSSIQSLKDLIDYSNNTSGLWAGGTEKLFMEKLDQINVLIAQNEPDEAIISQVNCATEIWKRRNVVITNK